MVAVNFAFSGTELIGIAAGETENPRKVIPVAIRTTIARLIIFFIGTVFVLAALIPMQQAGVRKARLCWYLRKSGYRYRHLLTSCDPDGYCFCSELRVICLRAHAVVVVE